MYIAIEGVKGTGKSTLIDALFLDLKHKGIDFNIYAPTRPMPAHIELEQFAKHTVLTDQQRAELYTHRANYHAEKTDFTQDLVLGDRSILTSFVTRFPKNELEIPPYLNETRQQQKNVPIPDIVMYLYAPIDVVQRRLSKRQRDYGKHDETIDRIIEAHKAYEWLFEHKKQAGLQDMVVKYLDATQPAALLRSSVLNFLIKTLEKSNNFQ